MIFYLRCSISGYNRAGPCAKDEVKHVLNPRICLVISCVSVRCRRHKDGTSIVDKYNFFPRVRWRRCVQFWKAENFILCIGRIISLSQKMQCRWLCLSSCWTLVPHLALWLTMTTITITNLFCHRHPRSTIFPLKMISWPSYRKTDKLNTIGLLVAVDSQPSCLPLQIGRFSCFVLINQLPLPMPCWSVKKAVRQRASK